MKRIPWPFRRAAGGEIKPPPPDSDFDSVWAKLCEPTVAFEHRVEATGVVVIESYAPHRVEVTIDGSVGGWPRFEFSCTAPEGCPCRMTCAEDCGAYEDGEDCDCPQRDSGECNLVDWLNSGDWHSTSLYSGPAAPLRSDYVELKWDAEAAGVSWRYFGDPPRTVQDWGVGANGATEPAYWFSGDQYSDDEARNLACDTVARLGGTLWVRDTAAWREVTADA